MRGHAQICPMGMNVPVISMINHPKHLGLLKQLGFDKYAVFVQDEKFVEKVTDLISDIETHYSSIKKSLKQNMDVLNNRVADFLGDLKNKIQGDKND